MYSGAPHDDLQVDCPIVTLLKPKLASRVQHQVVQLYVSIGNVQAATRLSGNHELLEEKTRL